MNKGLLKKILPYLVLLIGIAYGIWPIDVIPDVPIVGWLDDVGIIGTAFIIALKIWSKKESDRKST